MTLSQPQYVFVRVEARIKARREADPDVMQREIIAHLYRFLNPLAGGIDRNGWPFGRDLYISEVYAILQSIPGVEYIEQVNLLLEGSQEVQVRIDVPSDALIASGEHYIVVV